MDTGDLPSDGYFVVKPKTYGNWVFYRAFVQGGDIAAAANDVKAAARVYPLSAAGNPPTQSFVDLSGSQITRFTPTISISTKKSTRSSSTRPPTPLTPRLSGWSLQSELKRDNRSRRTRI
jgi:hypothetical protein